MSNTLPTGDPNFSDLGLSPKLQQRLAELTFTTPTPIQAQTIPLGVAGKDVIGIAQTGTGKTLAFALPMLMQVARTHKRGLVIVPTRELAAQVAETFQSLGEGANLRGALLIGGAPMSHQLRRLQENPHVIIGTPGRINDHLERDPQLLSQVGMLVLDEADRMFDMGFAPQIARILARVPSQRQTLLFSATMPPAIRTLATRHMKNPVRVEVSRAGSVAENVTQELFVVGKDQKPHLLDNLLTKYSGTVLVFSRTKHGAKKICRTVRDAGHSAAEIHSNLSLSQRRRSLEGFKSGTYRVLVATDIAARGIDVTNIELVINYDLPDSPEDYVHRVGRTGRAGKTGQAISFLTPDQRGVVPALERLVCQPLPISTLPQLSATPAATPGVRRVEFRHDSRRPAAGRRSRVRQRQADRHEARIRVHR